MWSDLTDLDYDTDYLRNISNKIHFICSELSTAQSTQGFKSYLSTLTFMIYVIFALQLKSIWARS